MTARALLVSRNLLRSFALGQTSLERPITSLQFVSSGDGYEARTKGDYIYISRPSDRENQPWLVIDLTDKGPLRGLELEYRFEAFTRIARISLHMLDRHTAVPNSWRPFHDGSRISFQSSPRFGGETARILIESRYLGTGSIFAFRLDRSGTKNIAAVETDASLFRSAHEQISTILLTTPLPAAEASEPRGDAVELTEQLPQGALQGLKFKDWYDRILTSEQRRFIDLSLEHPIRLVGPAGSGKTVALVVKCLRHLYDAANSGKPIRVLYLTHAMSTVLLSEALFDAIDDSDAIYGALPGCEIDITTLHSLANSHMKYDFGGFSPLSLDGDAGRRRQMEILGGILNHFVKQDWITMKAGCSEPFRRYMDEAPSSQAQRFFTFELLNEFACVLDAEGVRKSPKNAQKYLKDERRTWMMKLDSAQERQVVLELYDRFRNELRQLQAIGVDQLISDYLNFLEGFKWDALRESQGYDAVFVDETHLFNRQERLVFRHLLRNDKKPAVIMAFDVRQSPLDTFVGISSATDESVNYWKDTKLGVVEKVELVDVFRYSPQISATLASLDGHFPGIHISEDWPTYVGVSKTASGPIPEAREYLTTVALYNDVFPRASYVQRKLPRRKKVAVLCASYDLFDQYANAGQHKELFISIRSRDELPTIVHSGKRFIFSLPEYVAGLQFEAVFLIEVNNDEIPRGPYSTSARRKFLSQLYLGASRAERMLEFSASKEHGGLSDLLNQAITEKLVLKIE